MRGCGIGVELGCCRAGRNPPALSLSEGVPVSGRSKVAEPRAHDVLVLGANLEGHGGDLARPRTGEDEKRRG